MATAEKLKRELVRPFKQLARNFLLPARRAAGTLRRIRYDASRGRLVRVTEGNQPAGREIAVLLIYQPQGVLESIYFTLTYLTEQGVSPVVVSNLPLSNEDRERLAAASWLVIERPNVGYDFGGYREGILTVLERGLLPEALYVLNDSIWFPLRSDSDTIARCREASEDIYGLKITTVKKRRYRREIVHSYFYRFSAQVVASEPFIRYWKYLRLINHKPTVVGEFEFKLSPHFSSCGFTVGSIATPQLVAEYLINLEDAEKMRDILSFQCTAFPSQAAYIRELQNGSSSGLPCRDQLAEALRDRGLFTGHLEKLP